MTHDYPEHTEGTRLARQARDLANQMKTPLYLVCHYTGYGPTHFADTDQMTRCGLPINSLWVILEVHPTKPCTCKRCLKKERKP